MYLDIRLSFHDFLTVKTLGPTRKCDHIENFNISCMKETRLFLSSTQMVVGVYGTFKVAVR